VIKDRRGRVIERTERMVTLRRFEPNGSGCPPLCWVAALRYDRSKRRLVAAG